MNEQDFDLEALEAFRAQFPGIVPDARGEVAGIPVEVVSFPWRIGTRVLVTVWQHNDPATVRAVDVSMVTILSVPGSQNADPV